jgi:hypothetical protein
MTDNVMASAFNVNNDVALQVTKVLSTEEVKRAIEGPGKDFGKSKISEDEHPPKLRW